MTRNPFGVGDVPDPNGQDVVDFAAKTKLNGTPDDVNAPAWGIPHADQNRATTAGEWSSRWNGGADPTIAGDSADKWKQGRGEARMIGDHVYILVDPDDGRHKGLTEARREGGNRLGKYKSIAGHRSD